MGGMTGVGAEPDRRLLLPSLQGYRASYAGRDVIAGLVLSALLVPQGMAYAELAGLPAVTGLYTSILCLVGYALVGPSRLLVLGPDSSLGPMIAATIIPLVAWAVTRRAPSCWRPRSECSPASSWWQQGSGASASWQTCCPSRRSSAT